MCTQNLIVACSSPQKKTKPRLKLLTHCKRVKHYAVNNGASLIVWSIMCIGWTALFHHHLYYSLFVNDEMKNFTQTYTPTHAHTYIKCGFTWWQKSKNNLRCEMKNEEWLLSGALIVHYLRKCFRNSPRVFLQCNLRPVFNTNEILQKMYEIHTYVMRKEGKMGSESLLFILWFWIFAWIYIFWGWKYFEF